MKLAVYDNLNEFAEDLVSIDVLEKKNFAEFVKEASKDELNVCFFDTTDGEFTCHIWFKDITKTKEDVVISGIAEAWAFYCNIHDEKVLAYIKTGCVLANAILKTLRTPA